VRVVNASIYPTQRVTEIVESEMEGDRRHPPTVRVSMRRDSQNTLAFTPFDHSLPIDLWLGRHYPQPGARNWETELRLSAAHEDWHFHHPDAPCERDACETLAEGYAHRRVAAVGRVRRRRRRLRRLL
jgi:hypothetical protein